MNVFFAICVFSTISINVASFKLKLELEFGGVVVIILLQPEHLTTEFQVKQLILFPSYWKILRFEENKINWYRKGKVIFLSYSPEEETI